MPARTSSALLFTMLNFLNVNVIYCIKQSVLVMMYIWNTGMQPDVLNNILCSGTGSNGGGSYGGSSQVLDQVAGTEMVDYVAGTQVLDQVAGSNVMDQLISGLAAGE